MVAEKGATAQWWHAHTCHAGSLGFEASWGRGMWRFSSHPSTLETAYLSWLTWPCKWRCCLPDIEWDVKSPLRICWQWPLSVSLYLSIYSIRIQGVMVVAMVCDFGAERSWVWVLAAAVWHCVPGQGTSPVCTLSQPKSEWVPGWTVIAHVFE